MHYRSVLAGGVNSPASQIQHVPQCCRWLRNLIPESLCLRRHMGTGTMEEPGMPRLPPLPPSVPLETPSFSFPVPRSSHRFGCLNRLRSLYCFSYIRPFNHQQTVSALRRIHQPPKTCPDIWGTAQGLAACFCSSPGPSCSFRTSDPIDFRGKWKKRSKTSWVSHLVSLPAIFSFPSATVIFMQGDEGEGTDAAPVSSLLSSRSQWCSP